MTNPARFRILPLVILVGLSTEARSEDVFPLTCRKYLETMNACVATLPEAARGPAQEALEQTRSAWLAIKDKDVLESSCVMVFDAAKEAMQPMCPEVSFGEPPVPPTRTCRVYVKQMKACLSELPEAAARAGADALRKTQETLAFESDRRVLEAACKSGLNTAKTSMKEFCPKVRFEVPKYKLPPTCSKYMKTLKACIAKLPEAARGPSLDALEETEETWAEIADKAALEDACKTALDSAKVAMSNMCPGVKFK